MRLKGLIVGAVAAMASGRLFGGILQAAQDVEDATAAFTPLLGSMERATELVARLNKEAATTPYQFDGISEVAKQLLPVMNGSIEDTAATFRMLGDTAGGNIEKLSSITRGYTKALLKGKPDMESLNMIAEAGVPIFTEMANSMGITVEKLFELSKQGNLTKDDLTGAFKRMTSDGGLFFKGMEIASQTLSGIFSTLKDNVKMAAANIGSALLPIIKKLAQGAIQIVGKISDWITANKELIGQKIEKVFQVVVDVGGRLWETLKKIWEAVGPIVISVGKGLFDAFKTIIGPVQDVIGQFSEMFNLLDMGPGKVNLLGKAFESLAGFLGTTVATVLTVVAGALDIIITQIQIVAKGLSSFKDILKGDKASAAAKGMEMNEMFKGMVEREGSRGKAIGGLWENYYTKALTASEQTRPNIQTSGFMPPITPGAAAATPPMVSSPGTESRQLIENKSTVEVTFPSLPPGTTITQKGHAPGVNLNYGYGKASLAGAAH